ncbi:putative transmembrane protein [Toxoplasma gondii TgCatPRC2]|uniref:Putative transmembrane protein n=1 Tax=Toxoplasma gondii TgCatPRC2 TaxID=1130821 RepID=A0A151HEZ9_TOXGO|nr:putative transmembrane protein [Toxoplasma gondii TgCatPRC2]
MFLSTWDLAGYTARQLGNYRYANLRVAQVFPVEPPSGNSFTSLMFDIFYVIDFVTPSEHMRWGPVAMSELRVARCQQKQEEMNVSFTLLNHDTLRRVWAPEFLNVQAFREASDVVIVSENAIEQHASFTIYSQDKLGITSSFDTLIGPIGALATGSRSYGNRWVNANSGRSKVSGPAAAVRLGQMVPLDNEVTGGETWATPRFTDEQTKLLRDAVAMTAQVTEACPNSKLHPSFESAPCVDTCHKGLTFTLLDGSDADPGCEPFGPSGQLVLFPCSGGSCSYIPFKLPQPSSDIFSSTALTGAVDRNILTAGPTFPGKASTGATFFFDELSDVWEFVAIFERKVSKQRDDLYFIFHHTETAEAARLKGGIGGDLPVPLPAPHQKGIYEAEQGAVYKWSEMDIRGVRAISIRYKTKGDFPATLKEIQVKGKPQKCPPHGFFADSSCPIVEIRPNTVTELDCEGEWGEWSMCDNQCRRTRFFNIKRHPRPGGKPCLLFEKNPCDGRPFCDSSHHLPNGEHYIGPDILKKSKRRDCKTHQSVWSACVNCRQLRYTHIIMHAALDGKPCPKERFEMRFCDPACEMWFTGGISSTRAPSTTAWSTRSTLRTTQVFTRNTTTTKEPLMIGGMPWYFIVAIAVANAGLLLVILGTAWCVLQRRHRQLSIILQMQESRELAEAEEKAHNAEALAAAAKEAARANVEGTPLASQPEAQSTTIKLTGTSPVHLKQRGWKTKDKRGKQHTSDAPVLRTPASKEEFFEPVP